MSDATKTDAAKQQAQYQGVKQPVMPGPEQDLWTKVDSYIEDTFGLNDEVLDAALADSTAAGLPSINVSAAQGKMLQVLARSLGARRILEIGTLGGYSTILLARALPADGRMVTLEYSPKHADVAKANIARAGLTQKVEVRVGRAIDNLPKLEAEGPGPFDLIFIDADKPSYCDYLAWSLRLGRLGTLIIADNVVRRGAVADPSLAATRANADSSREESNVEGIRRFYDAVKAEPRVVATAVQTVGSKGYDGFLIATIVS